MIVPSITERNVVKRAKKTTSRWFLALCDLFSESFSPLLVLQPLMFVHVGVAHGSLLMVGSAVLQFICAKLNLECTRLQHGNLHLGRNEDFETLISASKTEHSAMIAYAAKLYPVKLVMNSAITIMLCSHVADQVVSEILFGDAGEGQYLFGVLPALNSNHLPVPETELIKMSRGFLICIILALLT